MNQHRILKLRLSHTVSDQLSQGEARKEVRAGEGGLRIPEDIQLDEIEEKTY